MSGLLVRSVCLFSEGSGQARVEDDRFLLEPESRVLEFVNERRCVGEAQIVGPRSFERPLGHAFLPELRHHPSQSRVVFPEVAHDLGALRVEVAEVQEGEVFELIQDQPCGGGVPSRDVDHDPVFRHAQVDVGAEVLDE